MSYNDYFDGFAVNGFSCSIEHDESDTHGKDCTSHIILTFQLNKHFQSPDGQDRGKFNPAVYVDYKIDENGEMFESFRFDGCDFRFPDMKTLVAAIAGAKGQGYKYPADWLTAVFIRYWEVAKEEADRYAEQLLPIICKIRNEMPDRTAQLNAIRDKRFFQ